MADLPYEKVITSSAEKYTDFFNSIPAAIHRTTVEGKIVYCNWSYARLFGFNSTSELTAYPEINLYRNKKDRGVLVTSILQRGRVVDLPIPFVKKDGTTIWCAVTARAVIDDDGTVEHIDGVIKDITGQIEEQESQPSLNGAIDNQDEGIIVFDLQGNLIDVNKAVTEIIGFPKDELIGKSLSEFLLPGQKVLFLLFLSDILKIGHEEVILPVIDGNGHTRYIELEGILAKKNGRAYHIKGIARDMTQRAKQQKDRSTREKFQGVLEMAGGVAHRMNQPLTIINNLLDEVLFDLKSDDKIHNKIVSIDQQIKKLNDIIKKIGNIKKYKAMDYVAGIKIVDIDKAS
ncbi:MAG: PAS domain-containing protein [Thermodesulfobacteriota bacterium]|nr:PAS domain-containing protein [Thermodesulfobacteriota bacterium]